MEFLLLIQDRRGEAQRVPVGAEEMGKFARELAELGVLRGAGGPLRPEGEGARVRVGSGGASVREGAPLADAPGVVGGYFVVDVPDRAAAVELAKRCPYARAGFVEVRAMQFWRRDEGASPRFVFLYLWGPELTGPDEPRIAEMRAFAQVLTAERKLVGGARLPPEVPPARVEVRGHDVLVTDGPFAETKEIIAGFALIDARDRAEALELAKRVPHARWDTVVVRELARPS